MAIKLAYLGRKKRGVKVLLEGGGGSPYVAPPNTPALSISGSPSAATVGTAFDFLPSVFGGSGSKSYTLGGSLPPGMSFSSTTGRVSGTPTTAGTYVFNITVTDASGTVNLPNITVVVAAAQTQPQPAGLIADTSWRIQPTAVTVIGTTADATNITNLMNAKANNDVPSISASASTTAVIVKDIPAIPNGGLIWYASLLPANRTVTVEQSLDGGSTWNTVPHTEVKSEAAEVLMNRDQLVVLPATSTASKVRFSLANSSTGNHSFRIAWYALQADPAKNPIFGVPGMSVMFNGATVGALRDAFRSQFPDTTFDPLFFVTARSGARPADYLPEQLVGIIQPRTFIKQIIFDPGGNDWSANVKTEWANLTQTVKDQLYGDTQAIHAWAAAQGRTLHGLPSRFADPGPPPTAYNGYVFKVNQSAVVENGPSVSIANQENGVKPFNANLYIPQLPASSIDADTGLPRFDNYAAVLASFDTYYGMRHGAVTDGVHGGVYSTPYMRGICDAAAYAFGVTQQHYVKRRLDLYAAKGASPAIKNRMYMVIKSLDERMKPDVRAAWNTMVDNFATTYAEPASQVSPLTLPGIIASWDFDDPNSLYADDAMTKTIMEGDLIHAAPNKVTGVGGKLFKTGSGLGPNWPQPRWMLEKINGRPAATMEASTSVLNCTDTAILNQLAAAAQPFIIAWTQVVLPAGVRDMWALKAAGTKVLFARTGSSGQPRCQIASGSSSISQESNDPAVGSIAVYVLTYDGTTLKLRRNGVETMSVAYAKPAQAIDTFTIGGASVGVTSMLDMHMVSGSWTAATRDALENRLRAKAGV